MRKVILTIWFAALVLPGLAWANPGHVVRYNIEECITQVLRNNEELKSLRYDVYGSIARKIEATKRYVPVVKYKYRVAPVPQDLNNPTESFFSGDISIFNSIKIEAGVPISMFGRLEISKELADIGIDASKLMQQRKADEIVLDVYKLYYGIVLAREGKALAQKGLDAIGEKIEELEKEETVDQIEILKLKAILYQVDKKLDEANKKETVALAMLKYHTGLEDDVDFDIKDRALTRVNFSYGTFEEMIQQSKDTRPEFKLLTHQVNAKNKQVKLEQREYYPELVAGTFVEYGTSPGIIGDETETSFTNPFNYMKAGVGVELSSELDFRKIKSKVNVAKAEHLKAIADKRSKYRLLEIDLKNAYLDLKQKELLVWRSEKEKKSARQIVFLTKSNLDIGLGEKKDYLEALQSYLLIQAAVYENVYNYNIAVATVKQKIGKLYDPRGLATQGVYDLPKDFYE